MSYESSQLQDRVARATAHLETRTCHSCDAEHDVEIMVDGCTEWWTCPVCDYQNEDEHLTEPDPDDYNDAMADMALDD